MTQMTANANIVGVCYATLLTEYEAIHSQKRRIELEDNKDRIQPNFEEECREAARTN